MNVPKSEILQQSCPAFLFPSKLFTHTRIELENPNQRIVSECTQDRETFVLVLRRYSVQSEKVANIKTAASQEEVPSFALPEFGKHVLLSRMTFI